MAVSKMDEWNGKFKVKNFSAKYNIIKHFMQSDHVVGTIIQKLHSNMPKSNKKAVKHIECIIPNLLNTSRH